MSDQFKPGDPAILQNLPLILSHMNGMMCEVRSHFGRHSARGIHTGKKGWILGYGICVDGREFIVAPIALRRPPTCDDIWAARLVRQITKPINVHELEAV